MQLKKLCPRINANHEVDFRNSDQSRSLLQESMHTKKLTPGIHANQEVDPGIHANQKVDPGIHANKEFDPGFRAKQEVDCRNSYTSRIRLWEIIHIKNSSLGNHTHQEFDSGNPGKSRSWSWASANPNTSLAVV